MLEFGNGIKLLGIPVGYEHAPHVFNTRVSKIEAILNAPRSSRKDFGYIRQ